MSNKITVTRKVHREFDFDKGGPVEAHVDYVSADKPILFEFTRNAAVGEFFRSTDNGKSWSPAGAWPVRKEEIDENTDFNIVPSTSPVVVDPDNGVAFMIYMGIGVLKKFDQQFRDLPQWRMGRAYISYTYDEGVTWTEPKAIIQKGPEYDDVHWMKDVWFGKNGSWFEAPDIIKLSSGEFLMIMNVKRLLPSGDVYDSVHIPQFDAVSFLGRWNEAGTELEWEAGEAAPLDYNWSMNGICECAIAELADGRLLMISRAQWPGNESNPLVKLVCVSEDQGRTWSRVEPLRYDDGELVPVSAAWQSLHRSIRNGRIYLVANILPILLYPFKPYTDEEAELLTLYENPQPGLGTPRNPVLVGEIDPDTLRLKRDTLTVMEKLGPEEPVHTCLSNWRTYQDRETKKLMLIMVRHPGRDDVDYDPADRSQFPGVSRDVFCYEIEFPE
jgi:hypothetical protein